MKRRRWTDQEIAALRTLYTVCGDSGYPLVTYHQPYDVSRTSEWWTRALPGSEIGRAPMRRDA